ncbi:branched-chain amino acid ABC transporter permease [Aeromicrobium endophyticum]|uniref:Branched-chain amino acid ABC transporter permease n=1 Tax=Aeromicrobium endophyticum TaxID=2292704 RepID=A0A371PD79_9ACTN|nr:branched-chain amino acid ABC transporter permease [Aeromicrobium endophyticum]REK73350.1 branched-chain amino acid ABC transporter permease [Aeromicrobium endophyticum]
MNEILVILIRGAGVGSLYALIAMSLNLAYNATGVLNFAQGHLLVTAGVCTYLWMPDGAGTASPMWYLTLVAVLVATAVVGMIQGLITLIPMRRDGGSHSWVATTIAGSIVLGALITLWIGPQVVNVPNYFGFVPLPDGRVPGVYPMLVVLALVVWAGLRWYQSSFLSGLALNALSQDVDAARAAGVPALKFQMLAFGLAAAITAGAGFIGSSAIEISGSRGTNYVIFGFIVAVIGGIGNNKGALIAGPLFGVLMMYVSFELGGGLQVVTALAVIVAVLLLRPQGIFGRPHARRV